MVPAASPPADRFTHNSSLRSDFSGEERREKSGAGGVAAGDSSVDAACSNVHGSLLIKRRVKREEGRVG